MLMCLKTILPSLQQLIMTERIPFDQYPVSTLTGEVTNSKDAKDNHVNLPKGLRVRGLVYFNLRPTPTLEVSRGF